MSSQPLVAVYGAYGHTGSLVIRALQRRGFAVSALGRDAARLAELARDIDVPWHVADADSPGLLDSALRGADAVVLCAGPFGATAGPLLDAAMRKRICYFDTCAEPDVVQALFETRSTPAREAGIVAVPCLGYFGAIADWAVERLAGDPQPLQSIRIAYALDEWIPTRGSRAAAAALSGRRWVVDAGVLQLKPGAPPLGEHDFGGSVGRQRVLTEYPGPEVVLLHHRLAAASIRTAMSVAGLRRLVSDRNGRGPSVDLRNGAFRVEVCVRSESATRRAAFSGVDLYQVTAPIVVHVVQEVLLRAGEVRGLLTPAQAVPVESALAALRATAVQIEITAH